MSSFLSVPASLLVMGEYAVLEEGGLGIAMATAPRLQARLDESARLSVTMRFGGREERWRDGEGDPPVLVAACLSAVARLGGRLRGAVEIDAAPFYDAEGRKLGLGSSAAAALALCAALLRAAGMKEGGGNEDLFAPALEAHRALQGGRGSGYDVAASLHGGVGLFTGGAAPRWQSLHERSIPAFVLARGAAAVSSAAAIRAYEEWRSRSPAAATRFLRASNRRAERFAAATEEAERHAILGEAARAGVDLGRRIGVPAEAEIGTIKDHALGDLAGRGLAKALGAGNELIALFRADSEGGRPGAPELAVEEGLRWE